MEAASLPLDKLASVIMLVLTQSNSGKGLAVDSGKRTSTMDVDSSTH